MKVLTTHLFKTSITIFLLATTACTKKSSDTVNSAATTTPITIDAIQNCHAASNQYPSQITNNILGNWQWEKSFNPWTQKTTLASKHVLVHINDASTYHITENGITVSQGIWSLGKISETQWELKLTQNYTHTQGIIYLCNDELVLSSSYLDGNDNYFVKKSE